ncbi:MAG: AI-2E family transporter, partial [Cyanobacteria bacterium P01_H01_bin.121]
MESLLKLPRWAIVCLVFPLLCLNGWLLYQLGMRLQPITNIVVTASLIAFLLDYPVILLEKRRVPRGWAIALVLLAAVLITSLLIVFLGPLVWQQLNDFATRLPRWIEQAKTQLLILNDRAFFQRFPINIGQYTVQVTDQLSNLLQTGVSQIINVTLSTANLALNILITTVLSILLVINGERLWDGLLSWFSQPVQAKIRASLGPSFLGYYSGQATLAVILATTLCLTLIVLDVPFGLLFGIVIGVASIIPFGGL